jgi:hypothetical protein
MTFFAVGAKPRGSINIVPPVLGGVVSTGQSPTVTPGLWSKPTSFTYSLIKGANPIPGLDRVSKETVEAYQYKSSDLNQTIFLLEYALLGGKYAVSNSVFGVLFSGVALISTTNTYTAAGTVPNLPAGSSEMATALIWRKISATATNMANQNVVGRFSNNVSGWRLNTLDANGVSGRVRHIAYAVRADGNTVFTNSSQGIATTPTQNLIQRSISVLSGNTLSLYLNSALLASITCTGYIAPSTSIAFVVNTVAGSTDEWELISISHSDTNAMDATAVTSYDSQVVSLGSRIIPNATHHWEASDAGATWEDQLQGVALTRNGSPIVRTFEPQFQ